CCCLGNRLVCCVYGRSSRDQNQSRKKSTRSKFAPFGQERRKKNIVAFDFFSVYVVHQLELDFSSHRGLIVGGGGLQRCARLGSLTLLDGSFFSWVACCSGGAHAQEMGDRLAIGFRRHSE
ncbi:unnamed protein product, partial [Ectocarpus sp. 12 AP-2014]